MTLRHIAGTVTTTAAATALVQGVLGAPSALNADEHMQKAPACRFVQAADLWFGADSHRLNVRPK